MSNEKMENAKGCSGIVKLTLTTPLLALLLCGCASHYVMKLSNGTEVTTGSKPKLKGSTYYYKVGNGQVVAVPQSRVMEIRPASMGAAQNTFPTAPPPKKKHWWHFW